MGLEGEKEGREEEGEIFGNCDKHGGAKMTPQSKAPPKQSSQAPFPFKQC